jgi:hypothetical protein
VQPRCPITPIGRQPSPPPQRLPSPANRPPTSAIRRNAPARHPEIVPLGAGSLLDRILGDWTWEFRSFNHRFSLIFLEAVAIDMIISRHNVPEGLAKNDINRKRKIEISGYTHLTVIAHRMVTELDTYVWERVIRSDLKF